MPDPLPALVSTSLLLGRTAGAMIGRHVTVWIRAKGKSATDALGAVECQGGYEKTSKIGPADRLHRHGQHLRQTACCLLCW